MQARRRSSRLVLSLFAAACMASLVACAAGAEGTGDDDDITIDAARVDAPNNPNPDARLVDARPIDAPGLPIDAPISLPDGGIDLGDAGLGVCTPAPCGLLMCCSILGQCVPDLGIPGLCVGP